MPIRLGMEIHPQILIFAVSLAAIVALSGLALLLRLGGTAQLTSEPDAIKAAGEVHDGYQAVEAAVSADGAAAILNDASGQIMLIKRHGDRFAGRLLQSNARAQANGDLLSVDTGEKRFGRVQIQHTDAASWAEAVNRLKERRNA
ncbi:hypothetical protein [Erythrobacter ani]|uniref:Photosynthetic complex assembly protein n=1 Tax=Erythrobacter ani TaxID=2827235 RepID=A0ABS6SMZ5_9SPHN|nr:hypothetical protein [Erythrobacter ani]MBV7265778.1 hypothetical protein [Erythrobacter ani]